MSNQLEQLRAKLQQQQQNSNSNGGRDNALFQFWNMKNGETSVVRFLPNNDETNPFFWLERRIITLPFDGVLGNPQHDGKEIKVNVPCMRMYDKSAFCPVISEINQYWKTELEEIARKYWPKRSYLMQGFVRQAGEMQKGREDEEPENPIRRFIMNKSVHQIIQQSILDPDMENVPTDKENGTDFRIIKTQQGEYANYQTSSFARKETPLTDREREALETYGMFNLEDFIPNRPSNDGVEVIAEMFKASLDGQAYNPEWAEYFKPYGIEFNSTPSSPKQSSTESVKSPDPVEHTKQEKEVEEQDNSSDNSSDDSNDVLAKLRSKLNG